MNEQWHHAPWPNSEVGGISLVPTFLFYIPCITPSLKALRTFMWPLLPCDMQKWPD